MKKDQLREQKAKKLSARMIALISSIALALIATVLSLVLIKKDDAFILVAASVGIGVCTFFYAVAAAYLTFCFIQKNKSYALIGYVCAVFATAFLLIVLSVQWYVVLIMILAAMVIFWLLSVTLFSEKLTLVTDNERPEYKNYEQRKAENEANNANEQEEELPEIKSFKD